MGYEFSSRSIDITLIGRILLGINVVIAFCMGTDLESIMASPIAQPLATVRDWQTSILSMSYGS